MGITVSNARYTINGQLLPENPVFANLEKLCNSCGCWLTYDTHQGKWAVIINREGDSVQHFDDTNIIGPINLTTTGLDSYFNIMKATYVHEDLKGQTDFIEIEVPQVDQYPGETTNIMDLTYDLVTDPVQAQLLGFIELKQARADKVITFKTDYTKIGLKAGDIIDVTNSVYSWVDQKFRIINVKETDTEDGNIEIDIVALEYDPSVYDESNLNRYIRSDENGIVNGSILPPPDTPVVDKIEDDPRPRVIISTSLTGGLVDEVEFYVTNDVPPAFPNEEDRSYRYLTKANPTGEESVFPLNESITVEVDTLNTGNFLVKARAKNAGGVSEWSDPSGFIWEPTFTPDAIGPNTTVDGNTINGNGELGNALLHAGVMFCGSQGSLSYENVPRFTGPPEEFGSNYTLLGTNTFTANYTGHYVGTVTFNGGQSNLFMDSIGISNGLLGTRGDGAWCRVTLRNALTNSAITNESSGGPSGYWHWEDFAMVIAADLVIGTSYKLEFEAGWRSSTSDSQPYGITVGWQLFTVGAAS